MRHLIRSFAAALLALVVLVGLLGSTASAEDAAPSHDDGAPVEESQASEPAPAEPEWSLPAVSSTGSGVDDSVVRLYVAFFHRAPDAGGLAHWVGRYRGGESLAQIADHFTRTPEFTSAYGAALTSGDFVKLVYRNVLGREAADDLDGYNYWAPRVDNGTFTRGGLMVQFSESREFVSRTGTMAPEPPPMLGPPNSGSGKRIVYCISCQHVWLVEHDNTLTRHYAVSGREKTPRAGTYSVFSKSPLAWAGHDGITMQYMVRYTWGNTMALGFHSIPVRPDGTYLQTEAELGQYRSAGCTRQRLEDAEFLYHWAPVGTTVVVLP